MEPRHEKKSAREELIGSSQNLPNSMPLNVSQAGKPEALDGSLVGKVVMYNWGNGFGWCRAHVTQFYEEPKTKSLFNFELTYPKTSTTKREVRNTHLSLSMYGAGDVSHWFVVDDYEVNAIG